MVFASGRSQIWWKALIAAPQYAMAQLGSLLTSRLNWARASSYQKSCSRATPRLKGACDSAAQETGNETVPSRSFEVEAVRLADEWSTVWATIGRAANKRARNVR